MYRLLIAFAILLMPAVAAAQQSVTVRDIIELSKADLGEEALLALIEVNQPIFPLDAATLKTLKDAGVPSKVITAMIRSGRIQPAQEPALAQPLDLPAPATPVPPAPQVVVIEHHEQPQVREVPVPVPVYVAVPTRRIHRDADHDLRPPHVKPTRLVEPVFWGWGGKLRPDAWKPAIEVQKDAKIEVQKK
jgi:hypothetical protein